MSVAIERSEVNEFFCAEVHKQRVTSDPITLLLQKYYIEAS
jgi:hypothetical protein